MLNWFEKNAPIRLKFKILLVLLGMLTAGGMVTTYLAALDDPANVSRYVVAAGVLTIMTLLTTFIAGKLVSDPYVATVAHWEAPVREPRWP